MIRLVPCFFFALIVCQVKSENPLQDGAEKLQHFSQAIKREARELEKALAPSVSRFDHAMKNSFKMGQNGVKGVYDRAIQHLDTVPVECVHGVKNSLLQLQSSADKTFLSCSNLTIAVQDLGNLVTFTGNMLLGLARSVQELTWFTNCFSWNPIKSLPCFFEWIGLLYQGTKGLISSLSTFNAELDSSLLHILKVIEYCQARTTGEHSVLAVMKPVHQCANQPIPHHLYTVQKQLPSQ